MLENNEISAMEMDEIDFLDSEFFMSDDIEDDYESDYEDDF